MKDSLHGSSTPKKTKKSVPKRKRGVKRKVSFSSDVTTHDVPSVLPDCKRMLYYNRTDFRFFQSQERKRLDSEAADLLLQLMNGNTVEPTKESAISNARITLC